MLTEPQNIYPSHLNFKSKMLFWKYWKCKVKTLLSSPSDGNFYQCSVAGGKEFQYQHDGGR